MAEIAHIRSNTTKNYPCLTCGTPGNIIREGEDPRIKCNDPRCGFMYNASDSLAAVAAGAIPDGPPERPSEPDRTPTVPNEQPTASELRPTASAKLPRTLAYVIVSKDRSHYEFCNKKELKRIIFEWETSGRSYEVFELSPKQVTAKVEID